ncbi:MAG: EAL domain-containing protein [Pseudomonadales bacterium]
MKNLTKTKFHVIFTVTFLIGLFVFSFYFQQKHQQEVLLESRFEQLISVRESLSSYVNDYQQQTSRLLQSIANAPSTSTALKNFSNTFNSQSGHHSEKQLDLDILQHFQRHYLNDLISDTPNSEPKKLSSSYVPKQFAAKAAQSNYILGTLNPTSLGDYDRQHNTHHRYFSELRKTYQLYDIFLIDLQGNIVYTVIKEADFATNLNSGPYKNSGLAKAYQQSLNSAKGELSFATFKPYEPSLNVPAAFLATPVFNNGAQIGSVAIQIPIEQLNSIMTFAGKAQASGLGKSGEAYIVGSDLRMRNNSRFLADSNNELVQRLNTSIGVQLVDTPSVTEGLLGNKGSWIINDYRGIPVLSAYAAYNLFGENSVILAEIDEQEILGEIRAATNELLICSFAILLFFIIVIVLFFEQLIVRPLERLNTKLLADLNYQEKMVSISQSVLREYKKAVDMSAIVSKANPRGNITYANDAFCEISGYSRPELLGQNHRIIRHPDSPASIFKDLWQTISSKRTWKGIICNRRKDGQSYYVSNTIVPMLTQKGKVREYMSIRTDVTELFQQRQKLLMYTTDELTNLPNRQKFLEALSLLKEKLLAIVNIDDFSGINDYYGHQVGDQLLIKVAELLNNNTCDQVTVFRLCGDEYALLCKENTSPAEFEKTCEKLITLVDQQSISINGADLLISLSIGIASDPKDALIHANTALRVARESNRRVLFYNSDLSLKHRNEEKQLWTRKIKEAISDGRIALYLQPIIDPHTSQAVKYECLMRLIDEEGNAISPYQFLEIAKRARLYSALSKIIIQKSFDFFADRDQQFSINLSIIDIQNQEIIQLLKQRLSNPLIAERTVLEIVESEGIENYSDVSEFLYQMKSYGCSIAIDDFGTGYSNFEYLIKLDPDFIKIDGSIIKNVHFDESSERITKLIHDFSVNIGAKTIAEFVCDQSIADKLNSIGIDYMQGYLYGKPAPATELLSASKTANKRRH